MVYCKVLRLTCPYFDSNSAVGACKKFAPCEHKSSRAADGAYVILNLYKQNERILENQKKLMEQNKEILVNQRAAEHHSASDHLALVEKLNALIKLSQENGGR